MLKSFRALSLAVSVLSVSTSFAQIDFPNVLSAYDEPSEVISLKEAAGNLSGVVYNYDTDTYFVIQNNSYQIVEYDKAFSKALRVIKLLNLPDKDTEDVAYLGNDQFAINMESNAILIFTIKAGQTSVDVSPKLPTVQLLQLPEASKDNNGIEGLCYTARGGDGAGVLYAVQEKRPKRVFMVPRPNDLNDITVSRKLKFSEPMDAEKIFKHVMSDLSGCTYSDKFDHVLILSHESSRVMEVTKNGVVVKTMDLPPTAGAQYEGITIGPEGELVLASEPDKIIIFKPKK
jgi:uncharacterized protein YjiK